MYECAPRWTDDPRDQGSSLPSGVIRHATTSASTTRTPYGRTDDDNRRQAAGVLASFLYHAVNYTGTFGLVQEKSRDYSLSLDAREEQR